MKTFLCVIGFVMIALVSTANAQDRKPLETLKEWRGDNPNEGLTKDSPKFITNAKDLEKLWKAWDIKEKLPEIDFAKEILLVETTRGSRLNLKATLDEKGDLQSLGLATRDLRDGFRYVMITVNKAGIKTIAGKAITPVN
jgi:predicted small integral membrane protein